MTESIKVQMYNVRFPLTTAVVATKYCVHDTIRFLLEFSIITY